MSDPPRASSPADLLVVWAAAVASGRDVLVVGDRTGNTAARLAEAGARSVESVDSVDSVEQPPRLGFDLVLWFRGPEARRDPAPDIAAVRAVLKPEGVLLTDSTDDAEARSAERAAELRAQLRQTFEAVAVYREEVMTVAVAHPGVFGGPGAAPTTVSLDVAPGAGTRRRLLFGTSDATVPDPPASAVAASAGPEASPSLATEDAASAWEERARGAEAEAAVTRWELYIVREAWNAVLARLAEVEQRPLRRLAERVRRRPRRDTRATAGPR